MSVDKRVKYDVQGGVKNYLGKQKEVTAPLKWQSSPDHPTTELAYITEAEKDLLVKSDLHGSLKGGVNRGPSGIMSLNGWGSFDDPSDPSKDTGMSGAATSAAESGKNTSDTLAEGASYKDVQDYRSAFINAGGGQKVNPGFFDSKYTVSPEELAQAKKYRQDPNNLFANKAFKKTHGGGLGSFISGGGFFGNLIRGLGRKFGLGKRYNEPTYDMSEFSKLGLGGVDPTVNPNYYNDLDNELMLSTTATPQENKFNYMYDINDLASLIAAADQGELEVPGDNLPVLSASPNRNINYNRIQGYIDEYPNLGMEEIVESNTIPTINGVPMINTGSVYDNLNKDPYTYPAETTGIQTVANNENFPLRSDFLVDIKNNQDITTLPAAYEEINKMPINIDDPFSEYKNQQEFLKQNINNPDYYKVINDYTGSKFRL